MKTGCNGAYYKTKQPAHEMTNVQVAFYIQAACTLSAYYNRFFSIFIKVNQPIKRNRNLFSLSLSVKPFMMQVFFIPIFLKDFLCLLLLN